LSTQPMALHSQCEKTFRESQGPRPFLIADSICRSRWKILFEDTIGVDLRQVVRDGDGVNGHDPCEDGLRSVCWKVIARPLHQPRLTRQAFLLYGPLSQASWPKQLADSRSTYTSLRDHFLRFIDHPNDINSTADPLADDSTVSGLTD
jgi:TBC1 domain family member 5